MSRVTNVWVVFATILVLLPVQDSAGAKDESSSALPILVFQTDNKTVQDRTRTPVTLTVLVPRLKGSNASFLTNGNCKAELSVRGNTSYYFSKKGYRLELQDETGHDQKVPLLGLPADSDWVLYASVTNRTFVRNLLAHELWRATGRYAVRWQFAEVFLITNAAPGFSSECLAEQIPHTVDAIAITNPSAASINFSNANNVIAATLAESYVGVYVVMEKIKRARHRVDIHRLRPENVTEPEISGGYIFKKDDQGYGERGILTGQEFKLRYEEPKESELTAVQRQESLAHDA